MGVSAVSLCSIEGCPKNAKTRGWCSAHYERWRRNGDPGPAGDARLRPPMPCAVDGCEYVGSLCRGWCSKHYERWRRHGDPTHTERDYGAYRRVHNSGYVQVWAPDHPMASTYGYVFEHRMVAWDLGILTDPTDHVHHINHDKQDNRPENLEALSASEHHRRHMAEADYVENQYGRFAFVEGVCSIEDCDKPAASRGWCTSHYTRWKRSGDPLGKSTWKRAS